MKSTLLAAILLASSFAANAGPVSRGVMRSFIIGHHHSSYGSSYTAPYLPAPSRVSGKPDKQAVACNARMLLEAWQGYKANGMQPPAGLEATLEAGAKFCIKKEV